MTRPKIDPRRRQSDHDYNDINDLTTRDYEDFAAWDIHDYADEMRHHGDIDVPAFVPEDLKLKTKDLVALFDEKPSTVKWWLDSGQLESWPKNKAFKHRYTIPAAVVLFEMEYLPPTKRANWDALLIDEMI